MKARVTLTTIQINQLVDLGHREADSICCDLLHMVLPKRRIPLTPLIGPPRKTRTNSKAQQSTDSDPEDDNEWEDDDEDNDTDVEEEISEVAKDTQDDEATAAVDVARDAARYSKLCEKYDKTVQESANHAPVAVAGLSLPPLAPPSSTSVLI